MKRSLQLALLAAVALFALALACSSDEPAAQAPTSTSVPVPTATAKSEKTTCPLIRQEIVIQDRIGFSGKVQVRQANLGLERV